MAPSLVDRPKEAMIGETPGSGLVEVVARSPQTPPLFEILRTYCHQSRNLLNSMSMILYLLRCRGVKGRLEPLAGLEAHYRDVECFIDRIHQLCRPISLHPVHLSIGLLFEQHAGEWREMLATRGRRLVLEPPQEPAIGDFDPTTLGKGFQDLVRWRIQAGSGQTDLRLAWKAVDNQFQIEWDEPTHLGKGSRDSEGGSDGLEHLTLPLLNRIALAHQGQLQATSAPCWRLRMSWPLRICATPRDST